MAVAYTPEERERLMQAVCARMQSGEPLSHACDAEGVSDTTIQRWADDEVFPGASGMYARARDALIALKVRSIQAIADDAEPEAAHIAKARLRIEQERWALSRLMPKRFGERVQNEVSGANGGPIQYQAIERRIVDPED